MGATDDYEAPRRWVESFYESEREVRGVLDDVREAHLLGNHEDVREQLRAFAAAEEGIFHAIALAVLDVERFYEDLADQYDDPNETAPTEEFRTLGTEYDRLADDLELVLNERMKELYNPMPVLSRGFRYSESTQLPRLDYDGYSGNVKLCQFVHPPSQALLLARAVVGSTRELLDRVEENDDEIASYERERIATVYETLEDELAEMEAYVNREADPVADPSDLEPDDDWAFY